MSSSGTRTVPEEEDKAQSKLGTQSAFMSMLNMGILQHGLTDIATASNFGAELPDINDEGESEDEDEEDEDLHSSRGILPCSTTLFPRP